MTRSIPRSRRDGLRRVPWAARLAPCVLAVLGLAAASGGHRAAGQASWEYSPYRVRIWVATSAAAPELNPQVRDAVVKALGAGADAAAGATWDVSASPPPAALRAEMASGVETISSERIATVAGDVLTGDKLVLVRVAPSPGGYRIRAREFDCRSRMWGEVREREAGQLADLAETALEAVLDSFRPLLRIEDVEGDVAVVRIRAGGLILRGTCPSQVEAGAVLHPILRRNDRTGQPQPDGVQAVPWTCLLATARDGVQLNCRVYSGMRRPLGGRSSSRTERFALAVEPTRASTLVRLESLDDPPQPLAGYELYAADPAAAAPDAGPSKLKLLGRTDWRGGLDVPRGDAPLRILYVKNGGRVLARLPLVPGLDLQQTARLPNDDLRLEVEAYIRGFQNMVMDLAVRREILAARIRQRIQDGKAEEARILIDQFRQVQTRVELAPLLSQQRQRFSSSDKRMQELIDRLFSETEAAMTKYLDPGYADQLASELAKSG